MKMTPLPYSPYDFQHFIESMKGKGYADIIREAETRAVNIERSSFGVKGAVKRRRQGSMEFVERLGGLLFFLRYGRRPHGLSDYDFALLKPLTEQLVKRGELLPGVLKLFDEKE